MPELGEIAFALGYPAGVVGRLPTALTHKSFANEANEPAVHNERLEFLGDAVLGLVVGHALMLAHPEAPEGRLSRLRATLVNERSLARVAQDLGLGALLRLGRGEARSGGADKASLLADVYEAVIGALYLDLGLAAVERVVDDHFGERIALGEPEEAHRDYKTRTQELVQARFGVTPEYRVRGESGPEHDKTFEIEVWVNDRLYGVGEGRSKKSAERAAAAEAFKRLSELFAEPL